MKTPKEQADELARIIAQNIGYKVQPPKQDQKPKPKPGGGNGK